MIIRWLAFVVVSNICFYNTYTMDLENLTEQEIIDVTYQDLKDKDNYTARLINGKILCAECRPKYQPESPENNSYCLDYTSKIAANSQLAAECFKKLKTKFEKERYSRHFMSMPVSEK